ncbi:MAG: hypothetical protein GXP25_13625 [Planctomycetes bacterium]|nr:hypothetical protein [Planctomycetota bacterium]
MTTAVWYPTYAKPAPYTYPEHTPVQAVSTVHAPKTSLALDADPATRDGPFPFILFAHGGFGCATNSAFFTEYLARQGFIVAAPDFEDTIPPDFTRQVAFSRLGEGNVLHPLLMLRLIGKFVKALNADRAKCLWYATKFRLQPAQFIIKQVLKENNDTRSPLHGLIDKKAVGMMGHSLGGLTTVGLIGPNPDTHERRIKAALIFSAPVYPFEKDLGRVHIPLMSMYGDNDPNALGPDYPRSLLYGGIRAPRFQMILKDANHFTFSNPPCDDLSKERATNHQVKVIQDYGAAFFDRYLKGNRSAEAVLTQTDPALVHYKCELTPGSEHTWGQPPPPKGDGSAGGIREEVRKRMRAPRRHSRQ